MSYLQKIVFALPFYGKTFSNLIFFTHHCFRIIQFSKCTSFACFVASFLFLHSLPRLYKPQTFNGLLSASLASASCKPQRFFSLLPYEKSLVGLSGLEPPTSRLSGVRSNRLSYKPIESGIHLLSHAVSSIVPSAAYVLTVVFGMGTGVSHKRIDTRIL